MGKAIKVFVDNKAVELQEKALQLGYISPLGRNEVLIGDEMLGVIGLHLHNNKMEFVTTMTRWHLIDAKTMSASEFTKYANDELKKDPDLVNCYNCSDDIFEEEEEDLEFLFEEFQPFERVIVEGPMGYKVSLYSNRINHHKYKHQTICGYYTEVFKYNDNKHLLANGR